MRLSGLPGDRGNVNAAIVTVPSPSARVESPRPTSTSSSSEHNNSYEHHGKWNVRWFSKAVEDIVRRLDGTPASDQFTVVVNEGGTEAVILVKRIVRRVDLDAHHIAQVRKSGVENRNGLLALAMERVDELGVAGSSTGQGSTNLSPEQDEVEHVCQELLQASQVRLLVNTGQVGDCCDAGSGEAVDTSAASETAAKQQPKAFHGFWGVVVQTKDRSSVEGCYLLKAGCSVVERGCSCTHYTLTRVQEPRMPLGAQGAGEGVDYVPPVADQFVESWRTRRGVYL